MQEAIGPRVGWLQSPKRRTFMAAFIFLAYLHPLVVRGEAGFRAGLYFSQTSPLTDEQETAVLEDLRQWTGFVEIQPDENGRIVLGDRTGISGGSATARSLILGAMDGADSYTVEGGYRSPEVAFARIQARSDYVNQKAAPGLTRHCWSIQLDFHDYQELRGQAEAISAFDPGLNLLHELAHAVLRLRDSTSQADPLGDCERFINRIRREMGVPERESYLPVNGLAVTPAGTGQRVVGELTFVRIGPDKRIKKFRLTFDVLNVFAVAVVGRRPLV